MALVEDVISLLEQQDGLTAKEICKLLNLEPQREDDVYSALLKASKILRG
ncbi:hypothetical protein AFULGI_00024530 [Archaeoglobus fulgidus DSM 8774]|uniref:Uncharacterized protein n=1 Tax=Archaeoglobus fulgidus DSM 8774 TaxID=1344584 RepID=A0A075WFL6_ARCFL|nr:hypothetical protein [Archaeoglobus fulgidus]AIG99170.1 hypothetical protein AFULGI_00024530 [Archaeoglobus fulgidus DSM 8774]